MPPKGWSTVSVREEVRRGLEELAAKLGFSSLGDVVAFLLRSCGGSATQVPTGLDKVMVKLDLLEERLARIERELPITRVTPSEKPNIPEPTPENLRRIAAKLEQREVWPDEYPGNLTAGEILLLDRLVREGRAYYDHSTRRWRIAGVQP